MLFCKKFKPVVSTLLICSISFNLSLVKIFAQEDDGLFGNQVYENLNLYDEFEDEFTANELEQLSVDELIRMLTEFQVNKLSHDLELKQNRTNTENLDKAYKENINNELLRKGVRVSTDDQIKEFIQSTDNLKHESKLKDNQEVNFYMYDHIYEYPPNSGKRYILRTLQALITELNFNAAPFDKDTIPIVLHKDAQVNFSETNTFSVNLLKKTNNALIDAGIYNSTDLSWYNGLIGNDFIIEAGRYLVNVVSFHYVKEYDETTQCSNENFKLTLIWNTIYSGGNAIFTGYANGKPVISSMQFNLPSVDLLATNRPIGYNLVNSIFELCEDGSAAHGFPIQYISPSGLALELYFNPLKINLDDLYIIGYNIHAYDNTEAYTRYLLKYDSPKQLIA